MQAKAVGEALEEVAHVVTLVSESELALTVLEVVLKLALVGAPSDVLFFAEAMLAPVFKLALVAIFSVDVVIEESHAVELAFLVVALVDITVGERLDAADLLVFGPCAFEEALGLIIEEVAWTVVGSLLVAIDYVALVE